MTVPHEHSHELCRNFDVGSVVNLVEVLKSKIAFEGEGIPKRPWGDKPSFTAFREAFESGVHELPPEYLDAYANPLEAALPRLAAQAEKDPQVGRRNAEALLGAIYCHAQDESVTRPLHRLMAVTSFLFRAFVDDAKLAHLNLSKLKRLPPLVTMQQWGGQGPFVLKIRDVRRLIGQQATVGVVSIPSVLREHPVLWGILGHEIGGHEVQDAVPGLMPEFQDGIRTMFEQMAWACARAGNHYIADLNRFFGKLWSFWLNEAAADVYGILNIGPVFVFSLNAKLQALMRNPEVGHDMEGDLHVPLRAHPKPLFRIHLGIGVVQRLPGLDPHRREHYVKCMEDLAELCACGAKSVKIRGLLPNLRTGRMEPVDKEVPLHLMQLSAVSAGRFLASVPLTTLRGQNIQCIDTWDDSDELITADLIEAMRERKCALPIGDPSHIISAGAAEIFHNPDTYEETNEYIGEGLDRCFSRDPIWGNHTHEQHAADRYTDRQERNETL